MVPSLVVYEYKNMVKVKYVINIIYVGNRTSATEKTPLRSGIVKVTNKICMNSQRQIDTFASMVSWWLSTAELQTVLSEIKGTI